MKLFDVDNPPDTWPQFQREILRTVEDAEIEIDEAYDVALFTVSREKEAEILYVDELIELLGEDMPMEEVVEHHLPEIVKRNNSKFFAFVFPGFELTENEDGPELVCVLLGTLFDMSLTVSEVLREEDELYAELGPWTNHKPNDYPNLTVPFRKSITYQSE